MRVRSTHWFDSAVYFFSVICACILAWQVVPSNYLSGGGLVWIIISSFALIFRFVITLVLGRITKGHEEKRLKGDRAF